MKPQVKGILFDYGGTIDTNGTHWGIVLQNAYREVGLSLDETIFRDIYIHGERSLAASPIIAENDTFHDVLRKKLQLEIDYAISRGFLPENKETHRYISIIADNCYHAICSHTIRIRPLLEKLHKTYRTAVVSNFYGNLPAVLADLHLSDCFDAIIESARVGVRKPAPDIYRLGLQALQLTPAEAVIVGDSYKNDIAPAIALGILPIWLKGQGWDPEDDKRHTTMHTIGDLFDLSLLL